MNKARLGMLAMITLAACGHGAPPKVAVARPVAPSTAVPIALTGQGATLQLARVHGQKVAFVADEDAKAILTIDVDTRVILAETKLAGVPSQLYLARDRRLFATLRDVSALVVLTANDASTPLTVERTTKTAAEPIGLAATDTAVFVTTGSSHTLSAFDANTLALQFAATLPREPRAVVISDDGKTAFVSHAVGGHITRVELAAHEIELRGTPARNLVEIESDDSHPPGRPSGQGFALAKSAAVPGRIFAPAVLIEPGEPTERSRGYGNANTKETETPSIAVIDEDAKSAFEPSLTFDNHDVLRVAEKRIAKDARPECLLPRAAAIDPETHSLLVTCFGIDAVIAYDADAANPLLSEKRRWTVGAGPSGIVVDSETHRAIVWSQLDRTFSTFAVGGDALSETELSPPPPEKTSFPPILDADYARGRILFHAAGDARIAADGRACASCHPDGRDDGLTWTTPDGPRRSIALAGRVTTSAPYGWTGSASTVHNHVTETLWRLRGRGLKPAELDALVTYVTLMPGPPSEPSPVPNDRGRAIFAAGCASCHKDADYTDGERHNVQSASKIDDRLEYDTPSLRLVGSGGPYFHDGRYATLGELLKATDATMGSTGHLSESDRGALESFLTTL